MADTTAPAAPAVPAASAAQPLPLAGFHRRLGATFEPFEGYSVPAHYGSVEEEHRALTQGVGLVDRSWAGRLELVGADRQRFLNAQVTCDVKGLVPGDGAYGFFTDGQGKVLADVVILALEDRLLLELPPGRGGPIADHVKRYIIADRVEVMPADDLLPLTLLGPRAAELLSPLAPLPEGRWRHARVPVLGTEVRLSRHERLGAPAFTLWVSASLARLLAEGLLDRDRGLRPVGVRALEALRVEAGLPRFGAEYGPDTFPQESGIDEAVSYTKGCYLGQEVVARIHYRGQVNRLVRGLAFDGEPPSPGARLFFEGRDAGGVTSAVRSPALGRPIGLALVHRRAAVPGTRLTIGGSGGSGERRERRERRGRGARLAVRTRSLIAAPAWTGPEKEKARREAGLRCSGGLARPD